MAFCTNLLVHLLEQHARGAFVSSMLAAAAAAPGARQKQRQRQD